MALLLMLPSCRRVNPDLPDASLSVSMYIPGSTMTKAETGMVSPLEEELKITSLQIWAFLSSDGRLISYKSFTEGGLQQSGASRSTITRFGLPLSQGMFRQVST